MKWGGDEKYRWARQPTLRAHLAEVQRLAEWNRISREAAAPRPADRLPPRPAERPYFPGEDEPHGRDEFEWENRWRRGEGMDEWTWPEWCGWFGMAE